MKKFVLFMLVVGAYQNTLSQIDVHDKYDLSPEKWILTPVKGLKKGMGRLNLDFPEGVYWSVNIFTAQNKFLINRSIEGKHKSYELAPGNYHFMLNPVMVENVPIEEGKETKLKFGVLEINSNDWELRSEDGKEFLTSGNKITKIAMPVGKYQLIDGKNAARIAEVSELVIKSPEQTQNPVSDKWVIYSVPEYELPDNKGSLNLQFPQAQFAFNSYWIIRVYNKNNSMVHKGEPNDNGNFINKILDTGWYRVIINGIPVMNVPILGGKETRIKKGGIGLSGFPNGKWELREKNLNSYAVNNLVQDAIGGTLTFTQYQQVDVPVSDYIVSFKPEHNSEYPVYYAIKISDSSWTDLATFVSQHQPFGSTYWSMRRLPDYPENKGRLFSDYSGDVPWVIKVYHQNDSNATATYQSSAKKSQTGGFKFISLSPGTYDISLNNCRINGVMISRGYETKFKTGIVSMESAGNWSIVRHYKTWYGSTINQPVASGNKAGKILLPVGEYTVNINNTPKYHEVKEGSLSKF